MPALVNALVRRRLATISRMFCAALVLACGPLLFESDALAGEGVARVSVEGSATLVLVVGAEGTPEYGVEFAAQAERWAAAARAGGAELVRIGPGAPESTEATDREGLRAALAALDPAGPEPLWLVLIGHGTFDGKLAKFNLRGPDPSASELAAWLQPISRQTAVVAGFSASGAFLPVLSAPGRAIASATRSGNEYNYARFGDPLSRALQDPAADLDKDGQVSLLEAWLVADAATAEFYASNGRLATEHALLDDDGDGLGIPASWFRGTRAFKSAEDGRAPDGILASQLLLVPNARERSIPAEVRAERDELERRIAALRAGKDELLEDGYYAALEELMLPLARLHARIDVLLGDDGGED